MTTAKPAAPVARDADAELEALFAAIDDVILVLDAEGRYVKIAPTNPSLLYRPAAELLGKTLREVFDPVQAEQFMEYIRTALATRTTVHFEYSLPIAGREVWFSGAISPMSRDQVVLVGRDITDRKRAAERLRASEQRFRALVEHSSDVITLLALDGTVIYASPSTQPVLGYGATENVGRSAFELVHPDDRADALELFGELLQRPEIGDLRQPIHPAGTGLRRDRERGTERLRARPPRRPRRRPGAVRRAHATTRPPRQDRAARPAQGRELAPPRGGGREPPGRPGHPRDRRDLPRHHRAAAYGAGSAGDTVLAQRDVRIHDRRDPRGGSGGPHHQLQPHLRRAVADPRLDPRGQGQRPDARVRAGAGRRPGGIPEQDPRAVRAPGRVQLRRPDLQRRPHLRALLPTPADRREERRTRVDLPRRHRREAGRTNSARHLSDLRSRPCRPHPAGAVRRNPSDRG